MLMKIFNKGQVVIPSAMRKDLGLEIGDMLDVDINKEKQCIELKPRHGLVAETLAGSLSKFNIASKREMRQALEDGLSHGT